MKVPAPQPRSGGTNECPVRRNDLLQNSTLGCGGTRPRPPRRGGIPLNNLRENSTLQIALEHAWHFRAAERRQNKAQGVSPG